MKGGGGDFVGLRSGACRFRGRGLSANFFDSIRGGGRQETLLDIFCNNFLEFVNAYLTDK